MKRFLALGLLILLALPVAGLALAACAPTGWFAPRLAGHWAPHLAIAALPLWCWKGRRAVFGGPLLVLVLAALWPWLIAAWAPRAPVAPADAPRAAIANVWMGNPHRIEALADLDAALVVYAEGHDADRQRLGRDPRWPHQVWNGGSGYEGLAVLSRFPIISQRIRFPEGAPCIEADIALPDGPLHLIAVHTWSPKGTRYDAINQRQISALAALARQHEGPLLLIGDLNATPGSSGLAELRAAGLLQPAARALPSWREPAPQLGIAIDHVLARGLELGEPQGVSLPGSDHRAVLVPLRRGASAP